MKAFRKLASFALVALLLPAPILAANGIIAGTVKRSDNQALITDGTALLLKASDFSEAGSFPLNGNGQYLFNVPAGSYLVLMFAPTFAGEIYDNVPCVSDSICDVESATTIVLADGQLKTADFLLDPLGSIAGTVRRSDTNALVAGVKLVAFDGAEEIASATTDQNGAYELFVYDGSFRVRTRNTPNLLDEYFDNVPCNVTGCNELAATQIAVQGAAHVTGKNFVLAPGSAVSGHVTRADGSPIDEFPAIEVSDAQGNVVGAVSPGFDGSWQLPFALASGTWHAAIQANPQSRYFPQVYDNRPCGGANADECVAVAGDPIVATPPNPVTDIDFRLVRRTARIEGQVTELASGNPLDGAFVAAYAVGSDTPVASTSTVSGGTYALEVPPGTWVLYVQGQFVPRPGPSAAKHESAGGLLGEVYPGLQCFSSPPYCGSPATPLELSADQDVSGADFALAPAAHVNVSLKNQDTNALMDGRLKILHPGTTSPLFQFVFTPAVTEVPVLNGGTLRLAGAAFACGPAGNRVCRAERNDGGLCVGLACDLTLGTGITVAKGGDAGSVEFLLQAGRRAGGFVRAADGQTGIPDVKVEFSIGDVKVAEATSAGDGSYEIGGLGGVPYFARTRAPAGYLDELYQELPCPPGQCTFSTGVSFMAPSDTNTALGTVNFTLVAGGGIKGTVTNALTAQFLGDTQLSVFDNAGTLVASATTLSDGSYATRALPPGNYFLFAARTGFKSSLYDGVACPGNACVPLSGTAVPVVAANDATGVDFALTPDVTVVPPRHKIFLNRCVGGCTVNAGLESSINNTSSIVSGTRNLSNALTDAQYDAFVACMRDMYAPFNADIVTTDPGPVTHQEVMIGASPAQVGFDSNVGGVSPWNCGEIRNAIVFAFTFGNADVQQLCETAAQELGHSFGLDHEYLCPDPMTYLEGCGDKHYQDVDAPCGEQGPRQCECGSQTQNSYRRLLLTLGASPAIFVDGFESAPAAKHAPDADDAKVFGKPRESGGPLDSARRPDDRIRVPRDRL